MDMDFAVKGPLVRRLAPLSGFCSSARAFARRFLRTPPLGGRPCALLPFTSIRLGEDFHFPAVIQCSAHPCLAAACCRVYEITECTAHPSEAARVRVSLFVE